MRNDSRMGGFPSLIMRSIWSRSRRTLDAMRPSVIRTKTMERFLYLKKVEQFLHIAITNDLFEVYYQPVYSLKEKRYITLEALSRLYHPELGWIPPDIFIQIAEKNHLVDRITNLQFRRICRFIQEHPLLTDRLCNVKMNLSPLDLIQTNSSSRLIRLMDEYGIKHSFIQFEITETVATEYNSALNTAVDDFADSGIGLCLDDFGSGYANLNTVMQLPFSAVKLDRSLLNKICEGSALRELLSQHRVFLPEYGIPCDLRGCGDSCRGKTFKRLRCRHDPGLLFLKTAPVGEAP